MQFPMIKKNIDDDKKAESVAGKKRSASDDGQDKESSDAKKAKIDKFEHMDDFELDKTTKAILLKDTINDKLWKECLAFKAKFKLDWLNNVENHFQCLICCVLLRMPITTDCAHNICQSCYKRSLSIEDQVSKCPTCRAEMPRDLAINNDLRAALNALFTGYESARAPAKPAKKEKGAGKKKKKSLTSDSTDEDTKENKENGAVNPAASDHDDDNQAVKAGSSKKRRPGPASKTGRAKEPTAGSPGKDDKTVSDEENQDVEAGPSTSSASKGKRGRPRSSTTTTKKKAGSKEPSPPNDEEYDEDKPSRRSRGNKRKSYKDFFD